MKILGIDPGLSGAICFLDSGTVETFDMPTFETIKSGRKRREVNAAELARIIADRNPDKAIIELVGAMPGQGVSSMFNFGRSFGAVEGVIAALQIPVTKVRPAKWKRDMGLSKDKGESRRRASEIYPAASEQFKLVKHDGRAEAALLATYLERNAA